MKEQQKLNINHAVTTYIGTKTDADLAKVYRDLLSEYQPKLTYWASSTYMANDHDMVEIFDDTFIKTIDVVESKSGDFVKLFHHSLHNRYKSLLRKLKTRRSFEMYDSYDGGDNVYNSGDTTDYLSFERMVNRNNTEDTTAATVLSKQKADQRQLIDFLVRGENERTTAIVQAFLNHPKPTATAIAKEIGLDHKQVSRALNRLAGKFSTKQFGNYHDYLVAL